MSEHQPPAAVNPRPRWTLPRTDPMEPVDDRPPSTSPPSTSPPSTSLPSTSLPSTSLPSTSPVLSSDHPTLQPTVRISAHRRQPTTLDRRKSLHWAVLLTVIALVASATTAAWLYGSFHQLLGHSTPPPTLPGPATTQTSPAQSSPAQSSPAESSPAESSPAESSPAERPLVSAPVQPDGGRPAVPQVPVKPPAADEPDRVGRQQLEEIGRHLTAARQAAVNRDWNTARDRLAAAEDMLRASPADQLEVQRLQAAAHRLGQLVDDAAAYWKAVDEAWSKLQPTAELVIDGQPMAVVEIDADAIVVRSAGQNRLFPRSRLPGKLARAVAASWLDPQRPDNLMLEAAFEALESNFRSTRPAELWQAAGRAGAQVGDLPLVLTDQYP